MTVRTVNTGLANVEKAVSAVMLGIIFFAITTGVISRYVLNVPIPWVEELSRFLFIWIGLLSSCYAFAHGEHMVLGIFFERLSSWGKRVLAIARSVVLEVLFIWMIVPSIRGSERYVLSNYLRVPESFVYTIVPISFVLLSFHNGARLITEIDDIIACSREREAE